MLLVASGETHVIFVEDKKNSYENIIQCWFG